MSKALLSADELEHIILAELQALTVCTGIESVNVTEETKFPGVNWRVASYGRPWQELNPDCYRRAIAVQKRLRGRYDVIWHHIGTHAAS